MSSKSKRSGNKNLILGGSAIILLFAVLVGFGVIDLSGLYSIALSSIGGGQIVSLSQVSYSTDATGSWTSDDVWKATAIVGTGGQQLVAGTYTSGATTLSDPTSGKESTKDTTISFSMDEMNCEYPLSIDSSKFPMKRIKSYGDFQMKSGDSRVSIQCAFDLGIGGIAGWDIDGSECVRIPDSCIGNEEITSGGGYARYCHGLSAGSREYHAYDCANPVNIFGISGVPSSGYKCIAVVPDSSDGISVMHNIGTKTVNAEATVSVSNGITSKNLKLTKDNNFVANDGTVYARLTGGILNFGTEECPTEGWLIIRQSGLFPEKYLISDARYIAIPTETAFVSNIRNADSESQINSLISLFNTNVQQARDHPDSPFSGVNEYVEYTGTTKITVDRLTSPIFYPMVNLEIDKDFVGVREAIADPKINSLTPSSISMKNTETKSISVSVTNEGSSGGIMLNVDCSGVTCTNCPVSDSWNEGQTKSKSITLRGEPTSTKTCYVTATDSRGGHEATKPFSITITEATVEFCSGNYAWNPEIEKCICALTCGTGYRVNPDSCTCERVEDPTDCQPPRAFRAHEGWIGDPDCEFVCDSNYERDDSGNCILSLPNGADGDFLAEYGIWLLMIGILALVGIVVYLVEFRK